MFTPQNSPGYTAPQLKNLNRLLSKLRSIKMYSGKTFTFKNKTYRILRDLDGHIATVSIPPRFSSIPPTASIYQSKEHLIAAAHKLTNETDELKYGIAFGFSSYTAEDLEDAYGEGGEPADALKIALEYGRVVYYNNAWLRPGDDDEYRWALDYFSRTLYAFLTWVTIKDAIRFIHSSIFAGAHSILVKQALIDALVAYDFIEVVKEEEK